MSNIKFYINKENKNNFIASNGDLKKEEYVELKANTTDASLEKHVPVYEIIDDKIKVTVGSTIHPMTEQHYIMWIALVHDTEVNMIKLKPTDKPEVEFNYYADSEIYAYCNLHGLWTSNVK